MPYFKAKKKTGGGGSDAKIYGAKWYGTADSSWERTMDAVDFADPSPAVNNGTGSSPFDEIMPWAGMVKVEDATGGTLVAIPKFYFRWIIDGVTMELHICTEQKEGFMCSPAHMDRGDGKGERDYVYVGRYHCANSDYKSKTGEQPKASVTRANYRTSIHALGSTIWQYDYAMFWTIMMLYLVEFADWNSQAKIGYGCSPSTAIANMGETDSMQYHTGTSAADRTTYGWTQYRFIEGLWDNVYDWCDGVYFSGTDVYAILNPADFSDTTGGTLVGIRTAVSNYISVFAKSSAQGFEWLMYPSEASGSDSTYVCDYYNYIASGVVLYVGGYYRQGQGRGLFCMNGGDSATYKNGYIGSRLMKLP